MTRPAPQTVFIAIHMADDSVAVMQFVTDDFASVKREPTVENIQSEIDRSYFGEGKRPIRQWHVLANGANDVPHDRTFRNSWTWRSGRIEHDMTKAREIHRDRLRDMRRPLLAALDADYLRADEGGDNKTKKDIAAKKQALRDAPNDPSIDAAQTPDELKAAVPIVLRT